MCGCAFNPRLAPAARPLIQAKPAVVNGVPRSLTKTKGDGALSLCRAAIEQFRQPREIDCHLSRLVHRQKAGMSCYVWVGSTVEHAELLPSGILDSKSARDLDDPPRRRKATSHVSPLCPLAIRLGGHPNNPLSNRTAAKATESNNSCIFYVFPFFKVSKA